MSLAFVLSLTGLAALLLVLRLILPMLPVPGLARRVAPIDLALTLLGVLGLVLHCTAMFFRPLVAAIPGTEPIIGQINSMGTASILWYTIPAVLTLLGLRRHHWSALLVLAATLAAVGVTMYNGTALSIHLNTIFAAGTAIAAVLFLLTVPSWQRQRLGTLRSAAH